MHDSLTTPRALLLSFPFCRAIKNNVVEGVHGRRLAEGGGQDDDVSPPSTLELVDLCIELEAELGPGEFSSEALRASPSIVEAFFDDFGGGEGPMLEAGPADLAGSLFEETQTPRSSSFTKRRPRSGDREDDDELAGPSWKVAKKETTPPPLVSSASPEAEELTPVSNAGVAPSTGEGTLPSSAEAGVEAPSGPPESGAIVHPWIRVPDLEAGATPTPFAPHRMTLKLMSRNHSPTMMWMRELLRKPTLSQHQASQLVINAEVLANNDGSAHQRMTAANERSIRLAMQLSAALHLHKNGSAPGDDEIVAFMRKIFYSRPSHRIAAAVRV
ncbi:hypothetical protein Esti_001860 [Eimeria stiedai]